ncbi:MAG: TIGR01212 family radical SAM protein, partial [Aquificae bacterium]|nr:TIGR01212 family radical SAM protein [Aquificota bacterium]
MTALKTKPYYSLKDYFAERYGRPVRKLTVALPFTCPNRDGTKGRGGCTYCYDGSKPSRLDARISLREQISAGIARIKQRYPDAYVFVYFQSYTNTYADTKRLKELYDTVLEFEEVVGLDVGTRPDCVPE